VLMPWSFYSIFFKKYEQEEKDRIEKKKIGANRKKM
jgi:hypothetical protein